MRSVFIGYALFLIVGSTLASAAGTNGNELRARVAEAGKDARGSIPEWATGKPIRCDVYFMDDRPDFAACVAELRNDRQNGSVAEFSQWITPPPPQQQFSVDMDVLANAIARAGGTWTEYDAMTEYPVVNSAWEINGEVIGEMAMPSDAQHADSDRLPVAVADPGGPLGVFAAKWRAFAYYRCSPIRYRSDQ